LPLPGAPSVMMPTGSVLAMLNGAVHPQPPNCKDVTSDFPMTSHSILSTWVRSGGQHRSVPDPHWLNWPPSDRVYFCDQCMNPTRRFDAFSWAETLPSRRTSP